MGNNTDMGQAHKLNAEANLCLTEKQCEDTIEDKILNSMDDIYDAMCNQHEEIQGFVSSVKRIHDLLKSDQYNQMALGICCGLFGMGEDKNPTVQSILRSFDKLRSDVISLKLVTKDLVEQLKSPPQIDSDGVTK